MTDPTILTTTQAAKLLICSPETVRRLLDRGILPSWRIPGSKHRRCRLIDVRQFMAQNGYSTLGAS